MLLLKSWILTVFWITTTTLLTKFKFWEAVAVIKIIWITSKKNALKFVFYFYIIFSFRFRSSFKTIIAKSEENYVVCLKGEHERKIGPQQIPFSCCSNPAVFEGCFAGVFNWTFPQCGIGSSPSGYLKNGCKKFISKSTSDLDVIGSLMIITGALFFLILSLNIVLTINILPTKALVVEEIFNEFQLDPNQAQKLENAFDMTTMTQSKQINIFVFVYFINCVSESLTTDLLLHIQLKLAIPDVIYLVRKTKIAH